MANDGRLKAQVWIDAQAGDSDIDLDLTSEQSVKILQYVLGGGTIHVNLRTPKTNGQVRENPAAYAVE